MTWQIPEHLPEEIRRLVAESLGPFSNHVARKLAETILLEAARSDAWKAYENEPNPWKTRVESAESSLDALRKELAEARRSDWEMEMASLVDVVNQELRVNGPIEVEQYNIGTAREGVRKLVDYLREKVERRERERDEAQSRVKDLIKTVAEKVAAMGELREEVEREKALRGAYVRNHEDEMKRRYAAESQVALMAPVVEAAEKYWHYSINRTDWPSGYHPVALEMKAALAALKPHTGGL